MMVLVADSFDVLAESPLLLQAVCNINYEVEGVTYIYGFKDLANPS